MRTMRTSCMLSLLRVSNGGMMRHDRNNFAPPDCVVRIAHRRHSPCVGGCTACKGERKGLPGRRVGLRLGREERRYESQSAVQGRVNVLYLFVVPGQAGRCRRRCVHILPREKRRRQWLVPDVQQEVVPCYGRQAGGVSRRFPSLDIFTPGSSSDSRSHSSHVTCRCLWSSASQ